LRRDTTHYSPMPRPDRCGKGQHVPLASPGWARPPHLVPLETKGVQVALLSRLMELGRTERERGVKSNP
jgi:hypothetical protein